jgi:hypothetical protein
MLFWRALMRLLIRLAAPAALHLTARPSPFRRHLCASTQQPRVARGLEFAVRWLGTLIALVPLTAPSYAVQPAPGSVRDFAVDLAVNGVPAGVVVPESEFVPRRSTAPSPDPVGKTSFVAKLPQLMSDFNLLARDMRAVSLNGVVRLQTTTLPDATRTLLAREIFIDATRQAPAGQAIFQLLVSRLQGATATGIAGSGIMPAPSCRLQDIVQISRGTYTVASYLDAVVTQLPGLVWLVTFDPERPNEDLKVGVVCPGGESLKMKIPSTR